MVDGSPRGEPTALYAAARLNDSQFSELFNATLLGQHPEATANLHALLWGVTAGVRAGRRGRQRSEAEVEQLADRVASTADQGLFDDGRGRANLNASRGGSVAVHNVSMDLTTNLADLYTVAACCNVAIDDRMRHSTVVSGSWQKRYRMYSKALLFQAQRLDRRRPYRAVAA